MKYVEDMTRTELEDEVLVLRDELGMRRRGDAQSCLQAAWKMRPNTARVGLMLYEAYPRPLSFEYIDDNLPGREPRDSLNVICVYACWLRKALGADTVVNVHGFGYRLTPKAHAKIKAVLETTQ